MMGWFKKDYLHPDLQTDKKECCPITPVIALLLQDMEENYADWRFDEEGFTYKEVVLRNDKRNISIYKYLASIARDRWVVMIPSGYYRFNETETKALDDLRNRKYKEHVARSNAEQIAELTKRLTTNPTTKKEGKKK